jgi:hypothetical protein
MSDEFRRVDSEFYIFLKFDKILKDIRFCPQCNAKIDIKIDISFLISFIRDNWDGGEVVSLRFSIW